MELKFPRHQVAMVTSHALSLITAHLCSNSSGTDNFLGKQPLDLSSMSEMTSLLRCLLCSKTAVTQLSNVDVDHLTSLLLQVYTQMLSNVVCSCCCCCCYCARLNILLPIFFLWLCTYTIPLSSVQRLCWYCYKHD